MCLTHKGLEVELGLAVRMPEENDFAEVGEPVELDVVKGSLAAELVGNCVNGLRRSEEST